MPKELKTLCPYCGVGCGLLVSSEANQIVKLRGDPSHPANFGKLCPKGGTLAQTVNVASRLKYAMLRETRGAAPLAVSPSRAIAHAAGRLEAVIQAHGPQAVAFYLSGQLTTEAQYIASKFAKGFLRTNHCDSNSRLCMSSAASGMTLSLGSDGPPTCYADIELADTFFFIGSNAARCHPVTFDRVERRIRKHGAKCIVADPRKTPTADAATVYLPLKPGTDLALLNGLLHLLVLWDKVDPAFIRAHTEGWPALHEMLAQYTPAYVSAICGISAADLTEAARLIGDARGLLTFWTMGINQSVAGTFSSNAIINLHLALGQIGRPGAGPFSLTGQPNAMGGRDVGYMSHLLPGQRQIANPEHRRQIEQFWGLVPGTLHPHGGYDAVRMFDALASGELKAIWIIGTNPAATMPNLPHVRRALEKAELVILQDAYWPTETTPYADIVFPAAVNLEQEGTFCNSERRVSLMEKIVEPPADAKPDWWWVRQVALAMGFNSGMSFHSAKDIFDEFARSTAGRPNDQSGLSYSVLRAKGPQCWPYPALGSEVQRRYTSRQFPTATGRARFFARPHLAPDDAPDGDFPLVLTNGRVGNQWHTRTKTGCVPNLNKLDPAPFLSMSPADARALSLSDGQRICIRSRRGLALATLKLDPELQSGVVFLPIHWNESWAHLASVNEVTDTQTDPISRQPGLKFCAVQVSAYAPEPALAAPPTTAQLEPSTA